MARPKMMNARKHKGNTISAPLKFWRRVDECRNKSGYSRSDFIVSMMMAILDSDQVLLNHEIRQLKLAIAQRKLQLDQLEIGQEQNRDAVDNAKIMDFIY